jgi:hypothetical protein
MTFSFAVVLIAMVVFGIVSATTIAYLNDVTAKKSCESKNGAIVKTIRDGIQRKDNIIV